jgi:hypothetical protein
MKLLPPFDAQRVRGGAWYAPLAHVRLVISGAPLCDLNNGGLGFRVVLEVR